MSLNKLAVYELNAHKTAILALLITDTSQLKGVVSSGGIYFFCTNSHENLSMVKSYKDEDEGL